MQKIGLLEKKLLHNTWKFEKNQPRVKKSKRIWRKVVVKGRTGWTYRDKPAKSQEKQENMKKSRGEKKDKLNI